MNEETIVLLLSLLHKIYPHEQFSFNLRYIKSKKDDKAFQIVLHREHQGEGFLFAQGDGFDLVEAQNNLVASIISLLRKSNDDMIAKLAKETTHVEERVRVLTDCMTELSATIWQANNPGTVQDPAFNPGG